MSNLRPRSQAGGPPPSPPTPTHEPGFAPQYMSPEQARVATREGLPTGALAPTLGALQKREPAEPGTPVDVTWGEEYFQPVQYHGIRVGPFKGTTLVRPGESVADAVFRLWCELNEVAMRIRDQKVQEYLREMVTIQKMVDGGGR